MSSTLSFVNAQVDDEAPFVFLKAGLFSAPGDCADVLDSVDAKWNIKNKWVAGCIVSDELLDSINQFNATTHQQLSQKYGKDWEEKYRKERSDACDQHLAILEQTYIDTFVRSGTKFSERIRTNPYSNGMMVQVFSESASNEKQTKVSINNLQDESNTILYRGFPNHFEITLPPSPQEYRIECVNCDILTHAFKDSLPTGQYYLKPSGSGKEGAVNIYANGELLSTKKFEIRNLPDPIIHLNDIPNGSSLPSQVLDSTLTIELRYSDDITLRSSFEILDWEMIVVGEEKLYGTGNEVNLEQLRKWTHPNSGKQLTIVCTVKGSDGVRRRTAAAFVLK